jgi:hypothetical protein
MIRLKDCAGIPNCEDSSSADFARSPSVSAIPRFATTGNARAIRDPTLIQPIAYMAVDGQRTLPLLSSSSSPSMDALPCNADLSNFITSFAEKCSKVIRSPGAKVQ